MQYFKSGAGYEEDGLIGGSSEVDICNVSLSSGASVERGELICRSSLGSWAAVSSSVDASKPLAIAYEDFTADSVSAVTPAYFAGTFNVEALKIGASLTADVFEHELRKQNIHLTSKKEA